MSKEVNNSQFLYWLKTMNLSSHEAAVLLKTTVPRIEAYTLGTLPLTPKHSGECRRQLRARGKAFYEDKDF